MNITHLQSVETGLIGIIIGISIFICILHVAVQNTVQSKKKITIQEIINLIIIEHPLPGSREAVPLVQLNEMQDLYFSESSQAMILNPPNLDNY